MAAATIEFLQAPFTLSMFGEVEFTKLQSGAAVHMADLDAAETGVQNHAVSVPAETLALTEHELVNNTELEWKTAVGSAQKGVKIITAVLYDGPGATNQLDADTLAVTVRSRKSTRGVWSRNIGTVRHDNI